MASILVVDDNATNRKLIVALLSHDGHVTFEARDGADALEIAGQTRPQLVISDILMPSMDGFEFLQRLRATAELRHIPVIVHTAHYHEREAHQLALSCGAARVLLKPCPAAQLLQAVEQVLAGVSESSAQTLTASFDREHLLLMTNKLAEKADALGAANARLTALGNLSVEFTAEPDPKMLLQKLCVGTRSLFGSRFALLCVSDGVTPGGLQFAASGVDLAGLPREPLRLFASRVSEVLGGCRAFRGSGSDPGDFDLELPPGYPQARAFLAVPLASANRAYGWLCLADKIGASSFDAEDEEFLLILAAQFVRHYEMACARMAAQRHVSRIYALLSGILTLSAQAGTQEEVCSAACRLVVQGGGFQFAGIGWLKPAAGEFVDVASAGKSADFAAFSRELSASNPAKENVVSAALRTGQPSVCNDLELYNSKLPCRELMLTWGYRAIVVLPLLPSGDRAASEGIPSGGDRAATERPAREPPAGATAYLLLGSRESQVFDDAEMRLLREFSRGISLALEAVERAK
jgi:CheY-like chemotaxis protein/GAF domain-containing protein